MKRLTKQALTVSIFLGVISVQAQEAVTADLDSCINSEKMSSTAKGAAIGAVTGFLGALASGKQDKAAQLALAGAAVGGIAGYANAYYNAVATCMKKNPAWIPESNIERKGNYKAIVKEFKYKPSQGDVFTVRPLKMPATISQGQNLEFPAKFVVLTPDGGEAQAQITRKLFVVEGDKETEVPFPGHSTTDRVLENGEHEELIHIPMGADVPAGSKFRFSYSVSVKGLPANAASGITVVK